MTQKTGGGPAFNRTVEAGLRRDRLVILAGLVALTLLAWLFVLDGAGTGMSVRAMTTWSFPPPIRPSMAMAWGIEYWVVMFFMWWIMMIAMMIPSVTPMVLLHARVSRHAQSKGQIGAGAIPSGVFLGGYLLVWLAFSLFATTLQFACEQLGVLSQSMMWSVNVWMTAALLVAAGLYQISPIKRVCLEHCRAPAEFLSRHWRKGRAGAFRMGVEHGAYCLGCCWTLMALLFVGGIMNIYWIAGLAIIVLLEKIMPRGDRLARVLGSTFVLAGAWIAIGAI